MRPGTVAVTSPARHLVLPQGDLPPLEAQHEFGVLCSRVNVLGHLFDLLRQVAAATTDPRKSYQKHAFEGLHHEMDQRPTAALNQRGGGGGWLLPDGLSLGCGLFVCFHCVPEMKGNISERLSPGTIEHLFPDNR